MSEPSTVLVTGGAGYVGAVLVPKLLAAGHNVKVLDLYIFGTRVLDAVKNNPRLQQIKGDLRDRKVLQRALAGCDAVIHLACISNDPSFELDPTLGKSINYDCFSDLVEIAKSSGVRRFIYASSSSVYGIKEVENVTEELPLQPLTDYSKYKALCEDDLLAARCPGFVTLILRPATICGYSPRLRLDLSVNILTNLAWNNRKITVFGGEQRRPNLHIEDMADLYVQCLKYEDRLIDGKIFNAGYQNLKIREIAEVVKAEIGPDVQIVTSATDDLRSYHISSAKIKRELGWEPRHTIQDAVRDLVAAFQAGKIPNSLTDPRYFNIKTMQAFSLRSNSLRCWRLRNVEPRPDRGARHPTRSPIGSWRNDEYHRSNTSLEDDMLTQTREPQYQGCLDIQRNARTDAVGFDEQPGLAGRPAAPGIRAVALQVRLEDAQR